MQRHTCISKEYIKDRFNSENKDTIQRLRINCADCKECNKRFKEVERSHGRIGGIKALLILSGVVLFIVFASLAYIGFS